MSRNIDNLVARYEEAQRHIYENEKKQRDLSMEWDTLIQLKRRLGKEVVNASEGEPIGKPLINIVLEYWGAAGPDCMAVQEGVLISES